VKTLSSKEQRIHDLEKALANRDEVSKREILDIHNKLKLLFKEYEKALMEFGVRPAPLPSDKGMSDFMKWIDIEFKALLKLSLVQMTSPPLFQLKVF
jgi:hypothetical protein